MKTEIHQAEDGTYQVVNANNYDEIICKGYADPDDAIKDEAEYHFNERLKAEGIEPPNSEIINDLKRGLKAVNKIYWESIHSRDTDEKFEYSRGDDLRTICDLAEESLSHLLKREKSAMIDDARKKKEPKVM